jgi:hypothetical protein
MTHENKWDKTMEEVLADFSTQQTELAIAHKLMDTAKNGGKVPLAVLEDAINRLDQKHHIAAESLRQLKARLR